MNEYDDEKIVRMVEKKTIVYLSRLSGRRTVQEVGRVLGVVRRGKDSWLEFVNDSGFHAVYLSGIVGVQ